MATHAPSSSSYSPLKVSVIVPALNEAGCIERSILSAKRRVRCLHESASLALSAEAQHAGARGNEAARI